MNYDIVSWFLQETYKYIPLVHIFRRMDNLDALPEASLHILLVLRHTFSVAYIGYIRLYILNYNFVWHLPNSIACLENCILVSCQY